MNSRFLGQNFSMINYVENSHNIYIHGIRRDDRPDCHLNWFLQNSFLESKYFTNFNLKENSIAIETCYEILNSWKSLVERSCRISLDPKFLFRALFRNTEK